MQDLVDSVIHPSIVWNVVFSSLHSSANRWFQAFVFTEDLSGLLRSGHLMVQFSGAPLRSAGVGQRVPPSPDSELRVQQHH